MKALTIKQPWANAIIYWGKDIENRDWPTKFRGRVAVHASKRIDREEVRAYESLVLRRRISALGSPVISAVDYGAIIGTVEIVDCVKKSDSAWFVGEYGFVLRNPIALPEPIPCRGALGFWNVPDEILARFIFAVDG